jgi:hypothetical protein
VFADDLREGRQIPRCRISLDSGAKAFFECALLARDIKYHSKKYKENIFLTMRFVGRKRARKQRRACRKFNSPEKRSDV